MPCRKAERIGIRGGIMGWQEATAAAAGAPPPPLTMWLNGVVRAVIVAYHSLASTLSLAQGKSDRQFKYGAVSA